MNGNANWTYDNLNRMSASPGMTYTHDILGNRTGRNYQPGQTPQNQSANARLYKWDVLNRMLATASPTAGARYVYRADGMRVEKIADVSLSWVEDPEAETAEASGWWDEFYTTNKPTTRYYYDGQMAVEEDFENGTAADAYVMRYGLGARGIDYMQRVKNNVTTTGFPLYDGHGNMVATLARSGSNSWSLNDKRYFDAWGDVEHGNGTGQPSQRYVANLGHVQDDESDLIYMRARYYEPGSGRFLSEDPAMDGRNWYIYCSNLPTMKSDSSGLADGWVYCFFTIGFMASAKAFFMLNAPGQGILDIRATARAAKIFAAIAIAAYALALGAAVNANPAIGKDFENMLSIGFIAAEIFASYKWIDFYLTKAINARNPSIASGWASKAGFAIFTYSLLIIGAIVAIDSI